MSRFSVLVMFGKHRVLVGIEDGWIMAATDGMNHWHAEGTFGSLFPNQLTVRPDSRLSDVVQVHVRRPFRLAAGMTLANSNAEHSAAARQSEAPRSGMGDHHTLVARDVGQDKQSISEPAR